MFGDLAVEKKFPGHAEVNEQETAPAERENDEFPSAADGPDSAANSRRQIAGGYSSLANFNIQYAPAGDGLEATYYGFDFG